MTYAHARWRSARSPAALADWSCVFGDLHDIIGRAIGGADWQTAAAALEVLGDVHAQLASGLERMSYGRAERIARKHGMASAARLAAKLSEVEKGTRDNMKHPP